MIDWNDELRYWAEFSTIVSEGGIRRCFKCGGTISFVECKMYLHCNHVQDMCVGYGNYIYINVPWCEACESEPDDHGCFHESWLSLE